MTDAAPDAPNADQAEFWSGTTGQAWVARQAQFDAMMTPVLDLLMDHAQPAPGEAVLDIGCGTGASLLRVATAVGPDGHVTGVDISPPMLDLARRRVAQAGLDHIETYLADAQTHAFTPRFHAALSRFGVMFFDDPVAAFANIRTAMRPGGRLTFVSWAGMPDNPWFRFPSKVAQARLGSVPRPDPRAPGPMAFSEQDYVLDILQSAGWDRPRAEIATLDLTPPGTVAEVAEFMGREGPASRVVAHHEGTEADIQAIIAGIATLIEDCKTPEGVRIPARLNVFSAAAAG
ncbi:class I SAM-dependent methyltransferase [Roseovarius aestuariivivens]|uniref:class I SAM-dependent methyltransferase n=1 Tax=Roseovarius aestuariivivens TaxID=1888910 RepID=UPI001081C717|nr:class I SAM-dependent methyltransferase [Roseovarius aestuariivivens]